MAKKQMILLIQLPVLSLLEGKQLTCSSTQKCTHIDQHPPCIKALFALGMFWFVLLNVVFGACSASNSAVFRVGFLSFALSYLRVKGTPGLFSAFLRFALGGSGDLRVCTSGSALWFSEDCIFVLEVLLLRVLHFGLCDVQLGRGYTLSLASLFHVKRVARWLAISVVRCGPCRAQPCRSRCLLAQSTRGQDLGSVKALRNMVSVLETVTMAYKGPIIIDFKI